MMGGRRGGCTLPPTCWTSAHASMSQHVWCASKNAGGVRLVGSTVHARRRWYCVQENEEAPTRQSGCESDADCKAEVLGSGGQSSVPTSACWCWWWCCCARWSDAPTHVHAGGWRSEGVTELHDSGRPQSKWLRHRSFNVGWKRDEMTANDAGCCSRHFDSMLLVTHQNCYTRSWYIVVHARVLIAKIKTVVVMIVHKKRTSSRTSSCQAQLTGRGQTSFRAAKPWVRGCAAPPPAARTWRRRQCPRPACCG